MRKFSLVLLTVAGVVIVLVAVLPAGQPVGDRVPAAARDLPVATQSAEPATSSTGPDDETPAQERAPAAPRRRFPAAGRTDGGAAPLEVKAIYLTSWSAATPSRITQAMGLIGQTTPWPTPPRAGSG